MCVKTRRRKARVASEGDAGGLTNIVSHHTLIISSKGWLRPENPCLKMKERSLLQAVTAHCVRSVLQVLPG